MSTKLVAVLGATGTQGGSVVTSLLAHGGYSVRAITRDTTSAKAQALKAKGIEVVSASLTDAPSLVKAFEGAYAVFGVTVPFTKDSEVLQGRNIVDAAKEAKVPLLVWSSLFSTSEASHGKYTTIYHFDQKSEVDKYARSSGQPTVIIHTGGFMENLIKFGQLQKDPSDANKWNIVYPVLRPDVLMPLVYITADLGNIVVAIIDHWEDDAWKSRLTKDVVVAAPYLASINDIVTLLKKLSGKEVVYVERPALDFEKVVYGFANEGYFRYPEQTILQELGVKTHSVEDYARVEVLPYIESAQ
ncbi:NADP-binding protein [Dacryopinax primogenitus]|uniref:NADP-binding protein n=1 Tax=Dacryopinax primogenitus (strain DJM 731) TaxID=1858805 RepID=M5FXZ2_DACPD|nr:NADP-binding protein [Dacryopinax primogenitus]EJU01394.1 NADP-binding protein [Dacryopinax primogenitus]